MTIFRLLPLFIAGIIMSGCASLAPKQTYEDQTISDPWQKANRWTYAFNDTTDKAIVKPAAQGYQAIVPAYARDRIGDFLQNLTEPVSLLNNMLQLKAEDSIMTLGRFVFNSTLGLGGFIDIATPMGIPRQSEDFGQTLAYWGVKPGPYIVLPFFGPSNLRDSISLVPDLLAGPTTNINSDSGTVAFQVIRVLDLRESLLPVDRLLDEQVDPYSFVKSGYEQNRINAIFDGNPPDPEEDF